MDWSLKYKNCVKCHRDSIRHVAKGLCKTCYFTKMYRNSPVRRKAQIKAVQKYRAKLKKLSTTRSK